MLSKNAAGLIILLLSVLGLEANAQGVVEVISAIGTVVSFALLIWNQINRPDVHNFIFKK